MIFSEESGKKMKSCIVSALCAVMIGAVSNAAWGADSSGHATAARSSEPARARMRMQSPVISNESIIEIRKLIGGAVKNGLAGNFSGFVSSLEKSDRERIGRAVDRKNIETANALNKEWSDRYPVVDWLSKDSLELIFSPYHVMPGSDTKHADVIIPSSEAVGTMTLKVVNEGTMMNSWKINIPDSISGNDLKGRLQKQLADINNSKASWPAKSDEAARNVAARILSTVAEPGGI